MMPRTQYESKMHAELEHVRSEFTVPSENELQHVLQELEDAYDSLRWMITNGRAK